MAKFMYRMQNILDIKLRLETQAKTEYAEFAAKLYDEEKKMEELSDKKRGYEDEYKELLSEKLNFTMISRCANAIEITKQQIKRQAITIHVARKNLDLARQRLNTAVQERKIHEKLKENAFEEFKQELNDQEKKEIDELVSFRYNDMNTGKEDK